MNSCRLTGHIHSLETLGAADGPGLRLVIFMQGCPLRCRYCHNPDTWAMNGGQKTSVSELVQKARRFQPYFGQSGGVTLSGGEPLMQAAFTAELLFSLKEAGFSTALDTCGWWPPAKDPEILSRILEQTDLAILDVKNPEPEKFQWLTGKNIEPLHHFLDACAAARTRLWIRQVIVPGWNDQTGDIEKLAGFLAGWPDLQLKKIELLPYHTLGLAKWQKLGQPYPLAGTKPLDPKVLQDLQMQADLLISQRRSQ